MDKIGSNDLEPHSPSADMAVFDYRPERSLTLDRRLRIALRPHYQNLS